MASKSVLGQWKTDLELTAFSAIYRERFHWSLSRNSDRRGFSRTGLRGHAGSYQRSDMPRQATDRR